MVNYWEKSSMTSIEANENKTDLSDIKKQWLLENITNKLYWIDNILEEFEKVYNDIYWNITWDFSENNKTEQQEHKSKQYLKYISFHLEDIHNKLVDKLEKMNGLKEIL